MWYLVYLTEHTNIPYESILEMELNVAIDYITQKQNLFVKKEREAVDSISIDRFRMTKEDEERFERGDK